MSRNQTVHTIKNRCRRQVHTVHVGIGLLVPVVIVVIVVVVVVVRIVVVLVVVMIILTPEG